MEAIVSLASFGLLCGLNQSEGLSSVFSRREDKSGLGPSTSTSSSLGLYFAIFEGWAFVSRAANTPFFFSTALGRVLQRYITVTAPPHVLSSRPALRYGSVR